jgi:hypothetical protein
VLLGGLALGGAVLAVAAWLPDRPGDGPEGDEPDAEPAGASVRLDLRDPEVVCGTAVTPSPAAPPATPPPADWVAAVSALYATRAAALETADPALLCQVYRPGSPALVADLDLLAAYAEAGVVPDEVAFTVTDARPVPDAAAAGGGMRLAVTDALAAYELVGADGASAGRHPGLPERTWTALLVPHPDGSGWVFG